MSTVDVWLAASIDRSPMKLGLLTLGDHRTDPVSGERTSQAEKHQQVLDHLDFAAPARFDTAIW